MEGAFWLVRSQEEIDSRVESFRKFLQESWNSKNPVCWTLKPYRDPRSLNQNALYWKWMGEFAQVWTARGTPMTKDDAHLICKYKILGTKDIVVNTTKITGQLISTKDLDKGEMNDYMTKVQVWCIDQNISLTAPEDSEYAELLKQMDQ